MPLNGEELLVDDATTRASDPSSGTAERQPVVERAAGVQRSRPGSIARQLGDGRRGRVGACPRSRVMAQISVAAPLRLRLTMTAATC